MKSLFHINDLLPVLILLRERELSRSYLITIKKLKDSEVLQFSVCIQVQGYF